MQISFELNGSIYRGKADWRDDDGLTADLNSLIDLDRRNLIPELPKTLIVRIDEARTALLIEPYIAAGSSFTHRYGSPGSKSMTIKANAIIEDLPWEFEATTLVEKVRISTTALQLWRGDENLSIKFNREGTGTAHFKGTKRSRKIALGRLIIEQHLNLPYGGFMGSLHIRSRTSAKLAYDSPRELLDCFFDVQAVEGYFDLLAAFPRRKVEVHLTFAGHEASYPMRVTCDQNEHTLDPNPDQTFFRFGVFDASGRTFNKYHANFSEYRLYQATLRHLSRNRLRLPEGFLTACNVIESLGRSAPSSKADLRPALNNIEAVLKEAPQMQELFKKRVRPAISLHPSFKDQFLYMKDFLGGFGIYIQLEHKPAIETRAKFRHKIHRLEPKDINVMSKLTEVAWIYGLTWLCTDIGISQKAIAAAIQSERFHIFRRTGLSSWGHIAKSGLRAH
jgi:hypothetical protein